MEIRPSYKLNLIIPKKVQQKKTNKKLKHVLLEEQQPVHNKENTKRVKKIVKNKADKQVTKKRVRNTQNKEDKKNAVKAQKKIVREQENRGKLLQQLTLIHERIERMDRDKDRYCLVDWCKKFEKGIYCFSIMRENEPFILKIDVKPDFNVVCNCMDWRIRCRKQMIPCKHIYYLFNKILGFQLYDYYDNQIMAPEIFEELVRSRLEINKERLMNLNANIQDRECPICFSDFKDYNITLVNRCPDCASCTHNDCAKVWLQHSVSKTCAICNSNKWGKNIK